ncbi:MAG: hypothetical protein H7328_00120 [Bdellovibrio sp.]|nr:hypothetical protein [Bdellovibrio sp.]
MANKKSKSQTLVTKFPDEGEIFKATVQKHAALIFFVHFYKGHKKALRRHIQFVNDLGYDAYAFNLKDDVSDHYGVPYSHISKKFGMKHAMADQIEEHLDLLSAYKEKVMFAFSNVAGCAIEVMGRRDNQGIKALICDSGPTANFVNSAYKLYKYAQPIKFAPLRLVAAPLLAYGWSSELHKDIPKDLQKLPDGFPVLSIRGWKDPLMVPAEIDKIFEPCTNLAWQKLSLPEATHLTGLRDFPEDYKPAVESFLNSAL